MSSNEVARQVASWIREHRLLLVEAVSPKGGKRVPGYVPPSWEKRTGTWSALLALPDADLTISVSDMGVPGDPRLIINFIPIRSRLPTFGGKPRRARK